MRSDPLARAGAVLRRAIDDPGDVEATPPARDEAIARLAEALRRRRASQRRRSVLLVVAAAMILVTAGVAARKPSPPMTQATSEGARVASSGGLLVVRDGREAKIATGDRVVDGAELRTPSGGEANLNFEGGSRLAVGPSSRVRLLEQARHKRFALDTGTLRASVAKLKPDERFVVTTADTEIEVRGTEFDVAIVASDPACEAGTPTRIVVREGVVVVRRRGTEARVGAGERWPACVAIPLAPSASPVPPSRSVGGHVGPRASSSSQAAVPVSPSSRLAEQNDLFQEALRRKRGGDAAGALEAFERLRSSYGDGPLGESAEVERFRILAGIDRARAAAAARDYLRDRPNGFARAEAESIASFEP